MCEVPGWSPPYSGFLCHSDNHTVSCVKEPVGLSHDTKSCVRLLVGLSHRDNGSHLMLGKKPKHDWRQSDCNRIADRRRTSPCKSCCLNLELVPHGSASHERTVTLPDRQPRNFLPSRKQVMALLSRAVVPKERGEFERRFREVGMGSVPMLPVLAILH